MLFTFLLFSFFFSVFFCCSSFHCSATSPCQVRLRGDAGRWVLPEPRRDCLRDVKALLGRLVGRSFRRKAWFLPEQLCRDFTRVKDLNIDLNRPTSTPKFLNEIWRSLPSFWVLWMPSTGATALMQFCFAELQEICSEYIVDSFFQSQSAASFYVISLFSCQTWLLLFYPDKYSFGVRVPNIFVQMCPISLFTFCDPPKECHIINALILAPQLLGSPFKVCFNNSKNTVHLCFSQWGPCAITKLMVFRLQSGSRCGFPPNCTQHRTGLGGN